jgi:ABC-type uncharacterized transport system substrate-binding protein
MSLFTHPHIIIDFSVELRVNPQGVPEGYYITWLFDSFFSQEVIFEVDRNRDGILQPNEVQMVYNFAFENTRHFNYFTRFQINQEPMVAVTRVEQFDARIENRQLWYRFFVPFSDNGARTSANTTRINVWVFDETFFSAFLPLDPPFVENPHQNSRFTVSSFRDTNTVIIFDPTDMGLSTSRTHPDVIQFTRRQ